jgi:hypothetical protein
MKCCDNFTGNISKEELEELEGLVCYCFEYSMQEVYQASLADEESKILESIKNKMKNPGCSCESKNPSKKCCLVDVRNLIKIAKEKT